MTASAGTGNGWRIKGWRDLSTVITIILLVAGSLAGAILWGIRIDDRSIRNENSITALETEADARPDPFPGTEAREMESRLQRQIDELQRLHDR